jgi:colanic acid biosynthesis glycosyl transferase WcaI
LKLENNFHLLGKHPVETMPIYFALADVLLVSLKKDPVFALTLPAKVQSYMACGRPLLACLDGEGAEVVDTSGAGISCPADDAEALAKSVLRLYDLTDEQRAQMGRQGKLYAHKYFQREALLAQLEGYMNALTEK